MQRAVIRFYDLRLAEDSKEGGKGRNVLEEQRGAEGSREEGGSTTMTTTGGGYATARTIGIIPRAYIANRNDNRSGEILRSVLSPNVRRADRSIRIGN